MQKIAVIGLGRFGMALARELAANGAEVIAIDRNSQLVNELKDDVDVAVRLDSTDEGALAAQEIGDVDICVVAIGENFEAALLTTVIAKRLGVEKIVCRAQTVYHAEIFRQIGADQVIQPEGEAGTHLARKLAHPQVVDFLSLAEGFTLIELVAPQAFCSKTLKETGLRSKYHVNLIAIKRPARADEGADEGAEAAPTQQIVSVPEPDDVIQPGDVLVLVGSDDALARLPKE